MTDTTEAADLARTILAGSAGERPADLVYTLTAREARTLAHAIIDMDNKLKSGEASDGYHTHNELYEYRTLYHAHAAMAWALNGVEVTKSWNHSDGEPCFGGGWFIVTAQLPTGQVSNHYPAEDWPLFHVPEVDRPAEWDGHTPQEASARIRAALTGYTDG